MYRAIRQRWPSESSINLKRDTFRSGRQNEIVSSARPVFPHSDTIDAISSSDPVDSNPSSVSWSEERNLDSPWLSYCSRFKYQPTIFLMSKSGRINPEYLPASFISFGLILTQIRSFDNQI